MKNKISIPKNSNVCIHMGPWLSFWSICLSRPSNKLISLLYFKIKLLNYIKYTQVSTHSQCMVIIRKYSIKLPKDQKKFS